MRILTPCLIMLGTLAWPSMGLAGDIAFNNGAWNTSFDYGQECDTSSGGTRCQDLVTNIPGPGWSGIGATEAVTAASNPNGDGGNGARFWVGDGKNSGPSPTLSLSLPQRENELWFRWYMRYEPGFTWSGGGGPSYDKFIYFWSHGAGSGGLALIFGYDGGKMKIWVGGASLPDIASNVSWTDVFGAPADGQFHMMEFYIKINSALGVSDGIGRMWIDGVKVAENTSADFTTGATKTGEILDGLEKFHFHSNQNNPANGGTAYVDYDDIAIYRVTPPNTSPDGDPWIGPLNGFSGAGSLPRPKSPAPVGVSFYDPIEDNNFTSRGWYDKTSTVLANSGATSGSTKSIEY